MPGEIAITDEASYRAALAKVSPLVDLDPEPASLEGRRLDALATAIEAYEAVHYPIDAPDPIDAIRFRMEQAGLQPVDLVPYIGPLEVVHHVLDGQRPLTQQMIRALIAIGIPGSSLARAPRMRD